MLTAAASLPSEQEEPLAITIAADGKLFIMNSEVSEVDLIPKLSAIASERASTYTAALDKDAYVPGAPAKLTYTVSDFGGRPVADGMWLKTFHSACVMILRRESGRLGHELAALAQ